MVQVTKRKLSIISSLVLAASVVTIGGLAYLANQFDSVVIAESQVQEMVDDQLPMVIPFEKSLLGATLTEGDIEVSAIRVEFAEDQVRLQMRASSETRSTSIPSFMATVSGQPQLIGSKVYFRPDDILIEQFDFAMKESTVPSQSIRDALVGIAKEKAREHISDDQLKDLVPNL